MKRCLIDRRGVFAHGGHEKPTGKLPVDWYWKKRLQFRLANCEREQITRTSPMFQVGQNSSPQRSSFPTGLPLPLPPAILLFEHRRTAQLAVAVVPPGEAHAGVGQQHTVPGSKNGWRLFVELADSLAKSCKDTICICLGKMSYDFLYSFILILVVCKNYPCRGECPNFACNLLQPLLSAVRLFAQRNWEDGMTLQNGAPDQRLTRRLNGGSSELVPFTADSGALGASSREHMSLSSKVSVSVASSLKH